MWSIHGMFQPTLTHEMPAQQAELQQGVLLKNYDTFNPLKTKRRLLYLKTQSVPRCKHFSSRL